MQWHLKTFEQLTQQQLYQILKLRVDIFVVEQNCPYSDMDDKDWQKDVRHFFAEQNGQIVAYLRLLPPGVSYPEMSSLGRVVTASCVRGSGIGHQMLAEAIKHLDQLWPDHTCHISAQAHLTGYYQQYGFVAVGEGYLEDDIPHIGMERSAASGVKTD